MSFCSTCQGIPVSFWSPGSIIIYPHHSLEVLHESARRGCPLCSFIAEKTGRVGFDKHPFAAVTLVRSAIDFEFGIQRLGAKGVWVKFSAMPPSWISSPSDDIALLKPWITACTEDHPACSKKGSQFRPTRLLNVGSTGSTSIIVEATRDQAHNVPYITLSHCWGSSSSRPATTTVLNFPERSRNISYTDLPLTFRDAIDITRALGMQYLWIDSLCIIQDSKDDWEKEAAMMGKIYASSFCTLAAAASADSNGGYRSGTTYSTSKNDPNYFDYTTDSQKIRILTSRFPMDWQMEYMVNPLGTRGWVLQERELSCRVIHFTRNAILWECKTSRSSSDLPWVDVNGSTRDQDKKLSEDSQRHAVYSRHKQCERWFSIVQDYSERSLTVGTDKLPALSGLALESKRFGDFYAAGLWKQALPLALLWRTRALLWSEKKPERSPVYRAPSWSWAAIDGTVTYDIIGELNLWNDLLLTNTEGSSLLKMIDINTSATHNDPMGHVSSGYIPLTGCLIPTSLKGKDYHQRNNFYDGGWRKILDKNGQVIGCLAPDVLADPDFEEVLFCLPVICSDRDLKMFTLHDGAFSGEKLRPEKQVVGLALRKSTGKQGTFTRVGLVRWMSSDILNWVQPRQIKII